ncbi:MAG: response regulator [Candidatus Omnitrophota bacterium]|jgi:CheY-like chemotaxis protein|nr:MAG: response regulator [Candidatus Omnitrophota bacterium]
MTTEPKKILVIEDEEDVVNFLKMALEDAGYEVGTAYDGEEAWLRIRENKPDLITLDMIMPNKTGIGLYNELRHSPEYKDIPIIVVTGVDTTSYGQMSCKEFLEKRAVRQPEAYLVKPINAEELVKTVRGVLGE